MKIRSGNVPALAAPGPRSPVEAPAQPGDHLHCTVPCGPARCTVQGGTGRRTQLQMGLPWRRGRAGTLCTESRRCRLSVTRAAKKPSAWPAPARCRRLDVMQPAKARNEWLLLPTPQSTDTQPGLGDYCWLLSYSIVTRTASLSWIYPLPIRPAPLHEF